MASVINGSHMTERYK